MDAMNNWWRVPLVAAYLMVLAAEFSSARMISPPLPQFQASDWDRDDTEYVALLPAEPLIYVTGSAPVGYTGNYFRLRIPL